MRLKTFLAKLISAPWRIVNGMGEMRLEVVVQRLDTLDEVSRMENTLNFTNPLNEMRCILRIRRCRFQCRATTKSRFSSIEN
jgi:hypothetical protein